MESLQARCPICLEDADTPSASSGKDLNVGGGGADSQQVQSCSGCLTAFHQSCACTTVVAAVEEGGPLRLPMRCPVPSCSIVWPEELITWALDKDQLLRYRTACLAAEELRAAAAGGGGSGAVCEGNTGMYGGSDAAPPDSPRSVEALRRLGTEARAGGVARCRCVGTQHNFIPQSNVLSNYRGDGGFGSSADEDLTKRKKGKATKQTLARLKKELKDLQADPPPFVHVRCDEGNALAWSFLIQGPADTPFEQGWFWGRLEVSKDYPFWPPLIRLLTPNGRFQPDQWLCRTLADYHPEGWQPAWSLAGAVHPPAQSAEIRQLAGASLEWNKAHPDFMKEFPDIDVLVASAALAAQRVAGESC